MSAGRFTRSRYAASYATAIHPIRVQPETIALASTDITPVTNSAPTGAISNPISALVTLGKRARGLRPRSISIQLLSTVTPPTGYVAGSVARVPILQENLYEVLNVGDDVTYLGVEWQVIGKSPEEAT